jgi:hypothetical protein
MMPRLLLLCALLLAWAPRASDGAVSFNLVGTPVARELRLLLLICVAFAFRLCTGSGFNNAGQLWFAGSAAYHNGLTVRVCACCAGAAA